MNTLFFNQSGKGFDEALNDKEYWGRLVESVIGAHLLNSIRGTQIEIYYWREKNEEVDFVLKRGKILIAVEVKSSSKKERLFVLESFSRQFNPYRLLVVGWEGISVEEFLKKPASYWFSR